MSDEGDYDDPRALLDEIRLQKTPPDPPPPKPPRASRRKLSPPRVDLGLGGAGAAGDRDAAAYSYTRVHGAASRVVPANSPIYEYGVAVGFSAAAAASLSSSEEDSDFDVRRIPTRIRSTEGKQKMRQDKLIVQGTIGGPGKTWTGGIQPQPSAYLEARRVYMEKQGIYQGLADVESVRKEIGIMPESMAMTTNLEESMQILESLSGPVIVPETPLPPQQQQPLSEPAAATTTAAKSYYYQEGQKGTQRLIPVYRDAALRAPPLPPLDQNAPHNERKAHSILESITNSEAAYLTSLQIAIKFYMTPLLHAVDTPSMVLDRESVETLFGPVLKIKEHHEVFYSALVSRTMEWRPYHQVGDIFHSSFNRKEVMQHYSEYVNNFADAMAMLEKNLKKKPKFVEFLETQYALSKTKLSLQGLLLKVVQRFPQYILFLQDLLKYTDHAHPDGVPRQMALARLECIAEYLNEAKRNKEQRSVVQYLTSKLQRLPPKIVRDSNNRMLYRQDVVTLLLYKKGKMFHKRRTLLLFSDMLLCVSTKEKASKAEPGGASPSYVTKWHSPLDRVQIILEPDYLKDIWDRSVESNEGTRLSKALYYRCKDLYHKYQQDFENLLKIITLISQLHHSYEGLTTEMVQRHIRVTQRKLAKSKEELQRQQKGRLDLAIAYGNGKIHTFTFVFKSESMKQKWLDTFRCAGLKQKEANTNAWALEDGDDEDIYSASMKLPLLVDTYKLNMINDLLSVECGTVIGSKNKAWLASGDQTTAQITVVECVTPRPVILECFEVESSRIMSIAYVPPKEQFGGRRYSVAPSSSQLPTVWLGCQCGKLMLYNCLDGASRSFIGTAKLSDSILCIQEFNKSHVFVGTAEGKLHVYSRSEDGSWDLESPKEIAVGNGPIRCMCVVAKKLWLAVDNCCHIINTNTLEVEDSIVLNENVHMTITSMVSVGGCVWLAWKETGVLALVHSTTHMTLQEIAIRPAVMRLLNSTKLEDRVDMVEKLKVTALVSSHGFLWIGTSVGLILLYRIPSLGGIPLISGKPYLAMDGHLESVRMILAIKTSSSLHSTRHNQFVSDEVSRNLTSEGDATDLMMHGMWRDESAASKTGPNGSRDDDTLLPSPLPSARKSFIYSTMSRTPRGTLQAAANPPPLIDFDESRVAVESATLSDPSFPTQQQVDQERDPTPQAEEAQGPSTTDHDTPPLETTHQASASSVQNSRSSADYVNVDFVGEQVQGSTSNDDDNGPSVASEDQDGVGDSVYDYPPDAFLIQQHQDPSPAESLEELEATLYEPVGIGTYEADVQPQVQPYEEPVTSTSVEGNATMRVMTLEHSSLNEHHEPGAIYVLSAGRGLVNLRSQSEKRAGTTGANKTYSIAMDQFPMEVSRSMTRSATPDTQRFEGCMIAYEIEHIV